MATNGRRARSRSPPAKTPTPPRTPPKPSPSPNPLSPGSPGSDTGAHFSFNVTVSQGRQFTDHITSVTVKAAGATVDDKGVPTEDSSGKPLWSYTKSIGDTDEKDGGIDIIVWKHPPGADREEIGTLRLQQRKYRVFRRDDCWRRLKKNGKKLKEEVKFTVQRTSRDTAEEALVPASFMEQLEYVCTCCGAFG